MIKPFRILALTSVGLLVASAHAEFQGPYTSLNAGASYVQYAYQGGAAVSGFHGVGANLFLGTTVNRYFAPELGAGFYGAGSVAKVEIYGLDFRITWPVGKTISLFGKVGPGVGELRTCSTPTCTTKSSFVPLIGAGIGYDVAKDWMATAEFNGADFPNNTGNGHGVMGGFTLGATRYWNT